MADAIMAGLSVGLAATGFGAPIAIGLGIAAAGMTMLAEKEMASGPDEKPVTLGDRGTPIDKTQAQEKAEVGKLKLGEDDKKKKRKKGKAAFKIELDKQKAEGGDEGTGVQVTAPKSTGIQL